MNSDGDNIEGVDTNEIPETLANEALEAKQIMTENEEELQQNAPIPQLQSNKPSESINNDIENEILNLVEEDLNNALIPDNFDVTDEGNPKTGPIPENRDGTQDIPDSSIIEPSTQTETLLNQISVPEEANNNNNNTSPIETTLIESTSINNNYSNIINQAPFKPQELISVKQNDPTPTQNKAYFAKPPKVPLDPILSESKDYGNLIGGDNPLIERVQEAIFRQLNERNERLEMELREKEFEMSNSKQKREEIGVELYNTQQDIAKVQGLISNIEKETEKTSKDRQKIDTKIKEIDTEHKETHVKLKSQKTNHDQQRDELEKVSRAIKQIGLYKEELESKVKLAKRVSLKAEEDSVRQEIEKKRQDYMIDNMIENHRKMQEKIAIYKAQIENQQNETRAISELIQDTTTEMEAIQFEKKQLFHQWKSAIISLQKRDEILGEVERGIEINKDTLVGLDASLNKYRTSFREAEEKGEALVSLSTKITGEIEYLNTQIESLDTKQDRVREEYAKYSQLFQSNTQEIKELDKTSKELQASLTSLEKQCQKIQKQTQKVDGEIIESLNEQLFIQKGNQGTVKDTTRLRLIINEKEAAQTLMNNEIATLELAVLNIKQRIEQYKADSNSLETDYSRHNKHILDLEQESKRMTDEIGKKQTEIGLMNKKFDHLTHLMDESSGPLESIIKNITREIAIREKETKLSQAAWLKGQNELLIISKKSSDIQQDIEDKEMRLTVLNRKKMVLDSSFESENKELKEYQRNIRKIQKDIERICSMVAGHKSTQAKLEEKNFGLIQEIRSRLKDAELETLKYEHQIEFITSEKEKALSGLIEAERQILLWEKKIQIAKETQAALDPNLGASEIHEMEAEIHRMKLRYNALLKIQEKMISDMERSVEQREVITNKTKGKAKGSSQIILERSISELNKKIKQTAMDIQDCERDIININNARDRIEGRFGESKSNMTEFEEQETQLLDKLGLLVNKKAIAMSITLLFQKIQKRYKEINDGKYVFLIKDPETRQHEVSKYETKFKALGNILKEVEVSSDWIKDMVAPLKAFFEI